VQNKKETKLPFPTVFAMRPSHISLLLPETPLHENRFFSEGSTLNLRPPPPQKKQKKSSELEQQEEGGEGNTVWSCGKFEARGRSQTKAETPASLPNPKFSNPQLYTLYPKA
jgi:hypothetical protein